MYQLVEPRIKKIVEHEQITAIGFIPPTLPRARQFQKELATLLRLPLPTLPLLKSSTTIPVPQKSLSRLEDRVENARQTIFIGSSQSYKHILLIDDAVGSGATLNETARKIKEKKLCTGKVIGLALTGSFKGFDVINEV